MNERPTGSLQALLSHCEGLPLESFVPGAVLIAEGPATDRLFILVTGEVEVLRGSTQVAEVGAPGAIFGEVSALLGGPHSATVRATTAVTAYRIDYAASLLRSGSEITFHVAQVLARRLVDATIYLADFKAQFIDRADHFGMVDEILEALVQGQKPAALPGGSDLKADSRL